MGASLSSSDGRRPRVLFYAMYDSTKPSNAPRVRIRMLQAAMAQRASLTVIGGSPRGRLGPAMAFLLRGGPWTVDAAYVESSTTAAMPWDIAVLGLLRIAGRPVGVFFRDAYQLFRDLYPRSGPRALLSDAAWRASIVLLRGLATVRYAPSTGLAKILRLRGAVLLPPGTDPATPDLGLGTEPLVAYVGARSAADGFDRLVAAMKIVRGEEADARLLAIGPVSDMDAQLPQWIETRMADRDALAAALAPARVCVIPRPINAYSNLARPVKLTDYLGFGKPIVATATDETRAVLAPTEAGLLVDDTPQEIAAGLLRILRDESLAGGLAERARALAVDAQMTWDCRAEQALAALVGEAPWRDD
jgi:glycosyltransferase involved in cell wall biosynthesis